MHDRWEFGGQPVIWELERQVLTDLFSRQKLQGDLAAHAASLQIGFELQKRMLGKQKVRGAVGRHHEQPKLTKLTGEVGQEIDSRDIRPVDVVKKQNDRLRARELFEE